jgi:hypothetical protein
MEKIPGGQEPTQSEVDAVLASIKITKRSQSKFTGETEKAVNNLPARTTWFDDKELRMMLAAFRNSQGFAANAIIKALIKEFDEALDARIKHKLGLAEAPETERDPVE